MSWGPLIGLTLETSPRSLKGISPSGERYVRMLTESRCRVRVLAPGEEEKTQGALEGLAGLCLSGGGDVDAFFYGEETSPRAHGVDRDRDGFELGLVEAARERGLPILGVCRGCQVLNVAYGGSLYQDIAEETPFPTAKHDYAAADPNRFHAIRIAPNHPLADVAGGSEAVVNTHHHQAVARLGHGLRVVAWADDGIVEAIAHVEEPSLGVQWHPERLAARDRWAISLFVMVCVSRGAEA